MRDNELITKDNSIIDNQKGDIAIVGILSQLARSFNDTFEQTEKTIEEIDKQLSVFQSQLHDARMLAPMSEDGKLEAAINKAMENRIKAINARESIMRSITKILQSKMMSEAMVEKAREHARLNKAPISDPIDVDDYIDE